MNECDNSTRKIHISSNFILSIRFPHHPKPTHSRKHREFPVTKVGVCLARRHVDDCPTGSVSKPSLLKINFCTKDGPGFL